MKELSPSEIYLLNMIYELGKADISELEDRVASEKKWKYSTVLTLARRLYEKGYLKIQKEGRRHIYIPKISQKSFFKRIMNRLFGSSLKKDPSLLITYFMDAKKINPEEVKLLHQILDRDKSDDVN